MVIRWGSGCGLLKLHLHCTSKIKKHVTVRTMAWEGLREAQAPYVHPATTMAPTLKTSSPRILTSLLRAKASVLKVSQRGPLRRETGWSDMTLYLHRPQCCLSHSAVWIVTSTSHKKKFRLKGFK